MSPDLQTNLLYYGDKPGRTRRPTWRRCGTAVAAAQKLILSPYQQAERIPDKKAAE